eukprot:4546402-Prymnesium_polylepis.1
MPLATRSCGAASGQKSGLSCGHVEAVVGEAMQFLLSPRGWAPIARRLARHKCAVLHTARAQRETRALAGRGFVDDCEQQHFAQSVDRGRSLLVGMLGNSTMVVACPPLSV